MSPLRARMIEDMTLAGLAGGTQKIYIQAVRRLAAHYRRSPDQLSEEEVRAYLLGLRQGGAARGTFKTSQYGLRFLYCRTLDRVWALFGEKKDRLPASEAAALALLANNGPVVLMDFGPPPVPQPTVSRLDRGAWRGLESQSGFIRAASSGA
jgi:Phage integrase, N-terminal SAM-like domain